MFWTKSPQYIWFRKISLIVVEHQEYVTLSVLFLNGVFIFKSIALCPVGFNIPSSFNFFDIAVSYYICSEIYKISNEEFKVALKDFKGLAHRLEYVTTKDNVSYYDDSISTIGETTIEGIKALKNVNTLVLGGMDRQIDYSNLEDFIIQDENLENLIFMPDTGTRIYKELQDKGNNKKW